ncbi:MAG: Cupin 2 conserved barrel domain protein [Frankiales bacterium]|jgi:uncharacterized cupin superfamily protein|nr:Cupin 2 conserved barrel domain protein [Frankiales bacterium]
MASIEGKSLSTPDETRTPDKSRIEVVHVGGSEVGRFSFEPGWRWSECIKPVVGTETCQAEHLGYVLSGQIGVSHTDGTKVEAGAGDAYHIAPGHDAWVIGDEPFVAVEFKGASTYAKP